MSELKRIIESCEKFVNAHDKSNRNSTSATTKTNNMPFDGTIDLHHDIPTPRYPSIIMHILLVSCSLYLRAGQISLILKHKTYSTKEAGKL